MNRMKRLPHGNLWTNVDEDRELATWNRILRLALVDQLADENVIQLIDHIFHRWLGGHEDELLNAEGFEVTELQTVIEMRCDDLKVALKNRVRIRGRNTTRMQVDRRKLAIKQRKNRLPQKH